MLPQINKVSKGEISNNSHQGWFLLVVLFAALLVTAGCGGGAEANKAGGGGGAPVSAFSIAAPASTPHYSNLDALTISGTCQEGDTISLSGDALQSATCAGGTYSFTLNKTTDASYLILVTRTPLEGSPQGQALTWVRDTVPPAAVSIVAPVASPTTTGDDTLTIWGSCEENATVLLSGDRALESSCVGNTFSFTFTETTVANYSYQVNQRDRAGNESTFVDQLWIRDPSLPATPTVTSPGTALHYSNTAPLTISGNCITGNTVDLAGAATNTQACAGDAFSFTVPDPGADGSYFYQITQTDAFFIQSAAAVQQWVLDTTPPATPVLLSPGISPYTAPGPLALQGTCETGATVTLGGDSTASVICAEGTYSFTVDAGADGSFNYTIDQTDRAGNVSAAPVNLNWVRDSAAVPPPTVTSPATNPFASNGDVLNVQGACISGYTVTLDDGVNAPQNALCIGGFYSAGVDRSAEGADAIYSLSITQDDGVLFSAPTGLTWERDITAPGLSLDSAPPAENPSHESTFVFSSADGTATFSCNLDGAGFVPCASPAAYSYLMPGAHTLDIVATDAVGNASAPASHAWSQSAFDTVALYHLDDAAPTADSSAYTAPLDSPLDVDVGTAAGETGFAQGRSFNGTSDLMSATHNGAQEGLIAMMTVEAFAKFYTTPGNGQRRIIASKTDNASAQSWVFGLQPVGGSSKFTLFLDVYLDGVLVTPLKSSNINVINTSSFYHVAVTWDKGLVEFFLNGVKIGTVQAGTLGVSTLFNSTAPLRVGGDASGTNHMHGVLDEVRISQVVRHTVDFIPPSAPYVAD